MGTKKINGEFKGRNGFTWMAELKQLGLDIWNYELPDIHIYRDKKTGKIRYEIKC